MHKYAHIFYSGKVQGVGFRYLVLGIARSLLLTGWVMNLTDGRVEVKLFGSEEIILKFIQETDLQMRKNITGKVINWEESNHVPGTFEIKH
ncbi:MAG: hypothetical protein A3H98_13925 [Bacteroidetes bacterium RIFCSPLOWO2_02_FULL_36_8]|nr:MAG: hypothetical protein A3H98_13925 [Bacteroidetes bacterium RIFCSPLOWO2_02_FULL_36_8]OFY70516.1 MAG: hypothetical protein A3G23_09005 [Bacteroidetes bacterium RIFCSPLOWO2_12_FULL_37_12]